MGALVGAVPFRRSRREAVLPHCQRDFALPAWQQSHRPAAALRAGATIAPSLVPLGFLREIGPQTGT